MKNYNKFFKLFMLFFSLVIFIMPVFAREDDSVGILSKIEIEQAGNNTYNLNLVFDKKYTSNALMQKNKNNSYYVFIPYAEINNKNMKIVYKNKYDKPNIVVTPEERTFIKDGMESTYVKLSVDTAGNYPINLYTKTIEEDRASFPFVNVNYSALIIIIALIFIFMGILISKTVNSKNKSSYTFFPSVKEDNSVNYDIDNSEKSQESITNRINVNETLKSSDSDVFSCFDIPNENNITNSKSIKYRSSLNKTSEIYKRKLAESKQTNPISKIYSDESSMLSLPAAEDILKQEKDINIEKEPNLLSRLEITPTKGFYLTSIDNKFALFGYVGKNVFLLKNFSDLTQINLQARFYDRQRNSDLYIVRLDSYKALVEISDAGMKELAAL